nr:LytR C-terminal domain-containing protein [Pseudoclavibacter sp. Marseille-Q3772]
MKYPKDRFDDLPKSLLRRGAHRAPRTRLSKMSSWIVALCAFVLLVGLGVGVMWMIDKQVQFIADDEPKQAQPTETATPSETPTPTPTGPSATVDPNMNVTVLNGVGTGGLATAGSEHLAQAGFTVGTVADADSFENPTTRVVIANEEARGAAMGVVEAIGVGEIAVDPEAATEGEIIVTLGADAEAKLLAE